MRKQAEPTRGSRLRALQMFGGGILAGLAVACGTEFIEPALSGADIDVDFEGASLESWRETTAGHFTPAIRRDTNSDFARWYSFRVRGGFGQAVELPKPAMTASGLNSITLLFLTVSGSPWSRVYNFSRWLAVADEIRLHPMVDTLELLANTLEGRPVHLVKVTDPSVPDAEKRAVWVIGRQHPAEVGGSWKGEGLLRWSLGGDPQASEFRRRVVLFMVPFMNPDGVWHGNYRVNSIGANLNREWDVRDVAVAPSVAATAARIESLVTAGGEIAFFADLHSFSILRKNFFFYAGADRAPPEKVQEIEALMARFEAINGDFTKDGSSPSGDDTRLARAWVQESFGVQAVTFESSGRRSSVLSILGRQGYRPARWLVRAPLPLCTAEGSLERERAGGEDATGFLPVHSETERVWHIEWWCCLETGSA